MSAPAKNLFAGLDEADKKAQVTVEGVPEVFRSGAVESFRELGLRQELLDGCTRMKFEHPSKIQAEALPIILSEQRPNVIGQAHAGSGKTGAFALAMLSLVDETKDFVQALCVAPTRELAVQVAEVTRELAHYTNIKVALAVKDGARGRCQAQVLVGTPGSVLNKMKHRDFDARQVRVLVVDEADTMLDESDGASRGRGARGRGRGGRGGRGGGGMGASMLKLQQQMQQAQILLFSATFPKKVRVFAMRFAPNAARISVHRENLTLDTIAQFAVICNNEADKFQALSDMYGLLNIGQSIIFCQTINTAKDITQRMRAEGFSVSLLYGRDLDPAERDRVMADFRAGATTVLITTNVLARGIDVLQVNVVINYDVPCDREGNAEPATYLHRIGRSGRFGRRGCALTFVHDAASRQKFAEIVRHYNTKSVELPADDLEMIETRVREVLGNGGDVDATGLAALSARVLEEEDKEKLQKEEATVDAATQEKKDEPEAPPAVAA